MSEKVVVRDLSLRDLDEVVRIHTSAFPRSALTRLGAEAVRRYYRWLIEGPHQAVRAGAFVGVDIVGFCFSGVFKGAMSGFLRANQAYLCLRVLTRPWIATNSIFRNRALRAIRILTRKNKRERRIDVPRPTFGILAIAVDPNRQGLGVGKVLMQQSEEVARKNAFREMSLTVSPSNHRAITFYEGLHWVRVAANGSWQGAMKKALD